MPSMTPEEYFKGRGAQIKTGNRFLKNEYVTEHVEGLDEEQFSSPITQVYYESPKKIVNKVTSPDLSMMAANTDVFIAMLEIPMNTGVSMLGWILSRKSLPKRMPRGCWRSLFFIPIGTQFRLASAGTLTATNQ